MKPAAQNPSTGRSLAQASRLDPLGDFPRSLLEELPNVTSAAPRERAQRARSTPAPRKKRCGQNGILRPKPRIDAARMASGIASWGRGLFARAWGLIHLSPLWWVVQRHRSQRGPAKRIERHYRRVVEALLPTARIHRVQVSRLKKSSACLSCSKQGMRDARRKCVCMHALRPAFSCGCRKVNPLGVESHWPWPLSLQMIISLLRGVPV